MITSLPPELIPCIIDFLHDNKAVLSACSLCCSTLAAISKPLLFHTLRTPLDSEAADRFEHLLESDPTLLPLVKRIEMTVSESCKSGADRTIEAISRIMTRCHAQHITPTLDIVIRPNQSSPYRFVESIMPWLTRVVNSVTSLELDKLHFVEDIQFRNFVLQFRMLKSLVLGRVNVQQSGVYTPSHPESTISHLSLQEASLGGGCNIPWFLANHPIPFPSLTSLDVRFRSVALDRDSLRFGEHYGSIVRTLRFGLLMFRHPTNFLDQFLHPITGFIPQFRDLESLTFQGLRLPASPLDALTTLEWIPNALRGVSPTVRKFTMEVVTDHLSHLDLVSWSVIDQILAHQLQSVTIVEILIASSFLRRRLSGNVWQDMKCRLPLAAERGVLRCSIVVDHPF